MADFLEAERHRFSHEYDEALPLFAKAQLKAKNDGDRYREERIIRPYLESILRSRRPNHHKAKELADRAVRLSRTFFSLSMRTRVYLRLWIASAPTEAESRRESYLDVLSELQRQTGAYSFYAQAKAEEEEALGQYPDAIEWMKEAVDASNRFDTRLRLWSLKTRSNDKKTITGLIGEIEEFVSLPGNRVEIESFALTIAERYARALRELGELKQFKIDRLSLPLTSREVRQVYLRAKDGSPMQWE
jgi:tetratricopeptide (TPR) repeat protein